MEIKVIHGGYGIIVDEYRVFPCGKDTTVFLKTKKDIVCINRIGDKKFKLKSKKTSKEKIIKGFKSLVGFIEKLEPIKIKEKRLF